jgi:thiamine-phosphate pyrophosphorylase
VADGGVAPDVVAASVEAGVDWVQVRDRELSSAALLARIDAIADAARAAAERAGRTLRIVVNRRADVALAAGTDGVHLGFDAMDPAAARRVLGSSALMGVSTHSIEEVAQAAAAGADYVHLAPIFPPLSKASERPPLGIETVTKAASHGVRVLAQGGVEASNAGGLVSAGAAGVAVTGAILAAPDPAAATAQLRRALDAPR